MRATAQRPMTCGFLLGTFLAAAAAAQAPPGPASGATYLERVDVELVTVDVWVTDSSGDPVTGLDATSFEVLHDGQPARVTHFTEVRDGADVATATPDSATAAPRGFLPIATPPAHLVLYFDQSRIQPSRYPGLIGTVKRLLDSEVDSERVLILRQDRALAVEASFGSSRQELEQALDRLARGTPSGMDLETETRQALAAIRDSWEQSQDSVGSALSGLAGVPADANQPPGGSGNSGGGGPRSVGSGARSGSGPDACGMFINQIQPTLDSWAWYYSQRTAVTLTNLSSTAGFLAGLPGVKTVFYFSDGLQARPGADLATYATSFCPGVGAELLSDSLANEMSTEFLALTRHANTNRVTIYALQTAGLRALTAGDAGGQRLARGGGGRRARGAFEASKRASDREGLGLIATETGGRAVFSQNDLTPELTRVASDVQNYYSLAYQPPPGSTGGERRSHQIEVNVSDASLTTRYRRGYLEKDPTQRLTERIEGALNLGLTDNPLEVRLGAGAIQEAAPGTYRLPLHVMVPAEHLAFLPQGKLFLADIRLRIMARPVNGTTMLVEDRSFQVQGAPGATGLADLPIELELGAGAYVTAIGVQDANTREASFISTTLQIGPQG